MDVTAVGDEFYVFAKAVPPANTYEDYIVRIQAVSLNVMVWTMDKL